MSDALTLSMPAGLPAADADAAAYFTDLSTRISASTTDNVVSIWTDPADDYSGVYPMVRAAVWYVPAGATAPDETTVATTPMLFFRTWLWDYVSLQTAMGGAPPPAVLTVTNLVESDVQTAAEAEVVSTNDRYASMSDTERADLISGFMAGTSPLLISTGTRLGLGDADSAMSGQRRVDITFYDGDGNILAPEFLFSVWKDVGGSLVDGHPLLDLLQGPVSPAIAPVDGDIRVRISGTGLTDATNVLFGSTAGSAVRANTDGTAVYVTVPAADAGSVDLTVDATIYPGAFTFTEDVVTTARAAIASQALYLEEVGDLARAGAADGTLDSAAKAALLYEIRWNLPTIIGSIERRAVNAGVAALDQEVLDLCTAADADIETLITDVTALIS